MIKNYQFQIYNLTKFVRFLFIRIYFETFTIAICLVNQQLK